MTQERACGGKIPDIGLHVRLSAQAWFVWIVCFKLRSMSGKGNVLYSQAEGRGRGDKRLFTPQL